MSFHKLTTFLRLNKHGIKNFHYFGVEMGRKIETESHTRLNSRRKKTELNAKKREFDEKKGKTQFETIEWRRTIDQPGSINYRIFQRT